MIGTSSKSLFENGRPDKEPGARVMGFNRSSRTELRNEGGQTVTRSARNLAGEKFSPSTKIAPDFSSDKELKADFSALILPFPDKVLADAADCSPETVKCWKAERSFPHGRHLMKLVADFPKIRAWHDRRTGGLSNPQSQSELFAYLEQVMASNTPEGRAMRARLQQIVEDMRG